MPLTLKDKLEQRRKSLRAEIHDRDWLNHWKDIAKYVQPRRGRFLESDRGRGQKRAQNIINNHAMLGLNTLAAGMMAGLSSPSRPWFKMQMVDRDLSAFPRVKEWLEEVTRRIRVVLSRSNFYNQLHINYGEQGGFGTNFMFILEDMRSIIRCEALTAGGLLSPEAARLREKQKPGNRKQSK